MAHPSPDCPAPVLVLASTSPRRRQLLTEAGIAHIAISPGIDDAVLAPGRVHVAAWVAALAYLKARAGALRMAGDECVPPADSRPSIGATTLVLGADTLCVQDGVIIGQARDENQARRILQGFSGRRHEVITGVALVRPDGERVTMFVDRASVDMGVLTARDIENYLAGGAWRGKAGAYNLTERLEAGWPIRFDGDPTTIVGLPMLRLRAFLERFGLRGAAA
ncbi:MAG: Maf family protein [Phycisphaeraceae bacterium]|nr:Maf family protein [Phycisphaeraceae bacterium]MCW5754971.1 Maf family protein [Phycisphaeraceae bacterium]